MVTVSKFYSRKIREGAAPSNPGNVDQPDAIPPVLNPPGSGGGQNPTGVSYLTLVDTDDSSYADKKDFVPYVNDLEDGLVLRRINKNVDGGFANSIYLEVQEIDGGSSIT